MRLFLGASQLVPVVNNLPATAGDMRHRFAPWVRKVPWRRYWQPMPVFLPGESPRTEEPGGLQSMGHKSWTQLKQLGTHARLFLEIHTGIFTSELIQQLRLLQKNSGLNFLGGSVVKIPHFLYRRRRFDSWLENEDSTCHVEHGQETTRGMAEV